jgi:hypothetical protein
MGHRDGYRRNAAVRFLVLAVAAAVVATTFGWGVADARLYRRTRNTDSPLFNDVRVCRDGIEFAIGVYWTADAVGLPVLESEPIRIHRLTPGTGTGITRDQGPVVIPTTWVTDIPFVTDHAQRLAIAPDWDRAPSVRTHMRRVTLRWAGGAILRPDTQLMGVFDAPSEDESQFGNEPTSSNNQPLVVERCKVFKPRKVKADIRPGVRRNAVDPRSNVPVPLAILSGNGFDARLTDPATVRVGTAPVQNASAADVDLDGDVDFTASFVPSAAGISCASRKVTIRADVRYGWPITAKGRLRPVC